MAKLKLKKPSKRQPARLRYKIEKKIRVHNRKQRKEGKKHPKKTNKVIQIPNICPFKEDILKEVEEMKKLKQEEREKQKQLAKLERQKQNDVKIKTITLENLVENATNRGKLHENFPIEPLNEKNFEKNKEISLKQYYKEFRKVVELSDVVLEIVDARDPLGTRCQQVSDAISEMPGNKRLVLVLNKSDLVPRTVLDKWLKYFKRSIPTVAFKASTQDQSHKLGQKKFAKAAKTTEGSSAVGAELLMSLLANYCRNKGIKTSITVGIVGLPNVGKSSIINSLKRSRACNVGAAPGVTKTLQPVQLDSKIRLLDSPGIVFTTGNDSSAILKNSIKISNLSDPIEPANAILQRVTKQQMMELYDINNYDTPDEFFSLKAARMGRFKRGGIPDSVAAARSLLEDWNSGKIKYYTIPPEVDSNSHVSSEIVTEIAKEFDLDSFKAMEAEVLNKFEEEVTEMNVDKDTDLLSEKMNVVTKKKSKKQVKEEKKLDPEMALQGNQKLNQIKKKQFKKEKKQQKRREKVALQLSTELESFSLNNSQENGDNYDFKTDY